MATLSHPPSLTTPNLTSINAPLNKPLSSKPSQLSALRSHRTLRCKFTCQANRSDDLQNPSDAIIDLRKLDRRNMLIGLGGMYGAAATLGGANPSALASPAIPDVKNCNLTNTSGGGPEGLECCPPAFKNIVNFDIRNYPSPRTRVRRPAHVVANDPEYMTKFKEAVRRMKALPRSDPRNFVQQANVHCAYCDGSYRQVDNPKIDLLVHGSWLFFPFHRAYLYFFERILGKLIDDPNFAMPYWNWDHPDGMRMPTIYTNPDSPLYDVLRDPAHQPPRLADLNYNNIDADVKEDLQIEYNLRVMNFQMTRNSKPKQFMGAPLLAGTHNDADADAGTGALENVPHNVLHGWVGDRNDQPFNRDMGAFFSAARDPLFYCHHSNVDRMWELWNKKLGNPNFTTTDWLHTFFVFYDENGQAVRMCTRDCLDIQQLGYSYEDQPLLWLDIDTSKIPKPKPQQAATVTFPKTLDSVIRTRVARLNASRSSKEKEVAKEVLEVSISVDKEDEYIKFDVFVNDGQDFDDAQTVVGRSYAGSFVSVPHKTRKGARMNMNRRITLPLTEILEDLGADNDDYVDVAIVPKAGKGDVTIKSVNVDYVI